MKTRALLLTLLIVLQASWIVNPVQAKHGDDACHSPLWCYDGHHDEGDGDDKDCYKAHLIDCPRCPSWCDDDDKDCDKPHLRYFPIGEIMGKVTCQDKEPLADETVKVECLIIKSIVFKTITGQNGYYLIFVPPGYYKVTVRDVSKYVLVFGNFIPRFRNFSINCEEPVTTTTTIIAPPSTTSTSSIPLPPPSTTTTTTTVQPITTTTVRPATTTTVQPITTTTCQPTTTTTCQPTTTTTTVCSPRPPRR